MKRSQMIKLLQESFLTHMNPDSQANTDEEMYSAILADLEKAGMKPPRTETSIDSYYRIWETE